MGHKRAAGKMEQRAPKTMSTSHMNKTTNNLALENIRISTSSTVTIIVQSMLTELSRVDRHFYFPGKGSQ